MYWQFVHVRFDTHDMAGVDAFETYRGRGWPGFAGAYDISGDIGRFFYRSTIVPAAQLTLYSFEVSGLTYRRTAASRRDGRDHILIQSNRTGGAVVGEMGGEIFHNGRVGVADFALDLQQTTFDTHAHCVLLDRDLFRPGEAETLRGFRWRSGGEALMAEYLASFVRLAESGAPPDAQRLMIVLRACKEGGVDALQAAAPDLQRVAVDRAVRFMKTRLHDRSLTPAAIAAAVGVSRATLYRLFAATGGVEAMMQNERLAAAARRLMTPADARSVPTLSIAAVAHEHGFGDAAHFSRAFRRRYGLRPSDLRL